MYFGIWVPCFRSLKGRSIIGVALDSKLSLSLSLRLFKYVNRYLGHAIFPIPHARRNEPDRMPLTPLIRSFFFFLIKDRRCRKVAFDAVTRVLRKLVESKKRSETHEEG